MAMFRANIEVWLFAFTGAPPLPGPTLLSDVERTPGCKLACGGAGESFCHCHYGSVSTMAPFCFSPGHQKPLNTFILQGTTLPVIKVNVHPLLLREGFRQWRECTRYVGQEAAKRLKAERTGRVSSAFRWARKAVYPSCKRSTSRSELTSRT